MKQSHVPSHHALRSAPYPNAVDPRQRLRRLADHTLCAVSTLGVTGILFLLAALF